MTETATNVAWAAATVEIANAHRMHEIDRLCKDLGISMSGPLALAALALGPDSSVQQETCMAVSMLEFAVLVRNKERERCAIVAESNVDFKPEMYNASFCDYSSGWDDATIKIAAKIRSGS